MSKKIKKYLNQIDKVNEIKKMISLSTITLSAEEADRFFEGVWDESVLKGSARKVMMDSETKNIRSIGIGTTRILHPAGTFTSTDYLDTFSHDLIQLSSKHLRCCVVVYDTDLEDINVGTPAQFKAHIMSMVAKKISTELDELYWIGDTEDLSGFEDTDARSMVDGWRYRFDHSQDGEDYENDVTGYTTILDASNTVSAAAAAYNLTTSQEIVERDSSEPFDQEFKFAKMLEHLPSRYKIGGLGKLRFFLNDQHISRYVEAMSKRATIVGDAAITGKGPVTFGTVQMVPVPLFPTEMIIASGDVQHEKLDTSTPGDLSDCLLTHENNLIIGFQRKLTMESQRDAASECTKFFFGIRVDTAVEDVAAAVLLKRLKLP